MLVFLSPRRGEELSATGRMAAWALVGAAFVTLSVGGFLIVQTEPLFEDLWLGGRSLGDRAGLETGLDIAVGVVGLVLVLVAAYRSVGLALPLLALGFLAYGYWGSTLPDWLLPHRGYGIDRLVSQTFLHSQGVFGVALKVMFTYVFLFVVFGALLEATGATEFIIGASRRMFRRSSGGPAKVAVISSGLMGSLSGSAVANTASTGTFTIPMMKSAGLPARTAAGLEAAASSGGALVPPVMGAGAYMMLEIIDPPVTYLQVIRAALIPAILYYLSLFLIVHFYSRGIGTTAAVTEEGDKPLVRWEGAVFGGGLGALIVQLLAGYTVFRSVTGAALLVVLLAAVRRRTRLGLGAVVAALRRAADAGTPLISAAACVGIVIGVVTLTGVGTRLPAIVLPLAQESLLLALGVIMLSSIVSGHGTAVGRLLPADGHLDRTGTGEAGSRAAGGAPVHLLLRHDVDGHAAGGAGRLRRQLDRRLGTDRDERQCFPLRTGRVRLAVCLRLPAAALDAVAGWWPRAAARCCCFDSAGGRWNRGARCGGCRTREPRSRAARACRAAGCCLSALLPGW